MEKKLLANRMITPDGTLMQSFNQHDYKTYKDTLSKEEYMIDGGLAYERRSLNYVPASDDSAYTTDSHEYIRERFAWGSYGKNGDERLHYIYLKDMETNHIKAILETQSHIQDYIRELFETELNWRFGNE